MIIAITYAAIIVHFFLHVKYTHNYVKYIFIYTGEHKKSAYLKLSKAQNLHVVFIDVNSEIHNNINCKSDEMKEVHNKKMTL